MSDSIFYQNNKLILTSNQMEDLLVCLKDIQELIISKENEKSISSNLTSIAIEVLQAKALGELINGIFKFLLKENSRSIELQIGGNKISADKLTAEEQQKLINWFEKQVDPNPHQ
jgi:hypothetical protein